MKYKDSIVILFGGESRERFVSVATAQNISNALPEADIWFWSKDGSVYNIARDELMSHINVFNSEFVPMQKNIIAPALENAFDLRNSKNKLFVLATHGGNGENGVIQKWLETRKLRFTGSGSKSSFLCMNKSIAKKIMKSHGFKTANFELISNKNKQDIAMILDQMILKYKVLILKPNTEGSSIGMSIIKSNNKDHLFNILEQFPEEIYLLEQYISGTEITVPVNVCSNKTINALMPIEIKINDKSVFANYEAKYLGTGISEIIPARIPKSTMSIAKEIAISAHNLLECRGYSRTDLIVKENDIFYLETNSLPGLTKYSLMPKALSYENISMREFIIQQLEFANCSN